MATDQHRVTGPAKLLRGALAALVATGSAAAAHTLAGHHSPHLVVLILSLAISIPVCVQLSGVALSRRRLAGAILTSQAVLHILFSLFPASRAQPSGLNPGLHHQHSAAPGVPSSPVGADSSHSLSAQTDSTMIAAHLLAAALAYFLLRRGETLLAAILDQLSITPVDLGWQPPQPIPDTRRICLTSQTPENDGDLWAGSGPRTLRGPPVDVK